MSLLTLEWMVCSPEAFALALPQGQPSAVQRAIVRAADGRPLDDLANHPAVIRSFGGEDAIRNLPKTAPTQVDILAGIRGAKSLICGAVGVYKALTCDLSPTRDNEPVQVPILSLKKGKAEIVFKHIYNALMTKPALRRLLAFPPTKEVITIRRPQDGRLVNILVTAGARAGGAVVAYWCASVIFDEAPRMLGEQDGVINFDETRAAATGRLLPGGQIWAVGSPWAPRGPIFKEVKEHFGRPTTELLVVRATGPDMNPFWWNPERIAKLRRAPDGEASYKTDVLAEFGDPKYSFFTETELMSTARGAIRVGETWQFAPNTPDDLPPEEGWKYGAAIDPATRSNAWTLTVSGVKEEEQPIRDVSLDDMFRQQDAGLNPFEPRMLFKFPLIAQWQGTAEMPLKGFEVFNDIARKVKPYGIRQIATDKWAFDAYREIAEKAKVDGEDYPLELILDERPSAEKTQSALKFRERVLNKTTELPPNAQFIEDFTNVEKRLTPEGIKIEPAQTADGRHGDFWPAALRSQEWACFQFPSWIDAMQRIEARGGKLFVEESADAVGPVYCPSCRMNYMGGCKEHAP